MDNSKALERTMEKKILDITGKKVSDITRMIYLFRYISLIVASSFFLINGSTNTTLTRKIFIISCISISAIIVNHLYIIHRNSRYKVLLLLFIETVGNSIILIPSGGLDSPYVWYSLNTILIASLLLDWKYCWLNVCIYLFDTTYLLQLIIEKNSSLHSFIREKSNLILSFILITAVTEILSLYVKNLESESFKLVEANKQLSIANFKIKQFVNYTMQLYQAVHMLTTQQSRNNLIELIVSCTEKVTKSSQVVFLHKLQDRLVIEGKSLSSGLNDELFWKQDLIWSADNQDTPVEIYLQNHCWMFIAVKCSYKTFGVLGVKLDMPDYHYCRQEIIEQLKFLSSLSSIVMEKFDLEQIKSKLLINEERNRIANEIHDSILQRLFSISCGIFGIIRKAERVNVHEQTTELNIIRNTINEVMKDLRSTIYGYSFQKNSSTNFINSINKYINEIKSLNNIDIDFKVEGAHEQLNTDQKNAIYRIICESCGNAIRHGKATQINIILVITNSNIELGIRDNGIGFDTRILNNKDSLGLGVANIHYLVRNLDGKIDYVSEVDKGSTINITLPLNTCLIKEEAV